MYMFPHHAIVELWSNKSGNNPVVSRITSCLSVLKGKLNVGNRVQFCLSQENLQRKVSFSGNHDIGIRTQGEKALSEGHSLFTSKHVQCVGYNKVNDLLGKYR